MKEIFLTGGVRLLTALGIGTVACGVPMAAADKLELLGGLFAGYILGAAWYGVMFGRLWRSAEMTAAQAKQQMVVGMFLRLMLMGAVFWAAIQVSFQQFLAAVGGFGLVYVLGLVMLGLANRQLFRK